MSCLRAEHQPIDGDARGLVGDRFDRFAFVKDAVGRFAHGEIGDDARAAGMDEGLAGAASPASKASMAPR